MSRFPESGRNISKQICETTGAELRKRCRTAEIVLHIHLHSQWQQYLIIEALLLFNHTHLRKQNKKKFLHVVKTEVQQIACYLIIYFSF